MVHIFVMMEDFLFFLHGWSGHLLSTAFAATVWLGIVVHLFMTGHATPGRNGISDDIGCGDIRIFRVFVVFGGPAGLGFGVPYYLLMNSLNLQGLFREYWIGFIYIQFGTSVIQTIILIAYSIVGKRSVKIARLFKSHLKGCGWISAVSPVGWVLYLIQQFLSNKFKIAMWLVRDIETIFAFVANIVLGPAVAVSLAASICNQRLIIPCLTWIDKDHKKDEDSN